MKERPILFSGPMVRAILEGRKCQTRRVVKLGPDGHVRGELAYVESLPRARAVFRDSIPDDPVPIEVACPYGAIRDRLWVRETWAPRSLGHWKHLDPHMVPLYRADEDRPEWRNIWRPSIHMPRWASRLLLEVTKVRVQRLQDISERDARAEGVLNAVELDTIRLEEDLHPGGLWWGRLRFRELWDEINGERAPWASNPWVWVVSFRRVEA